MKRIAWLLLILLSAASCRSTRTISSAVDIRHDNPYVDEYASLYAAIAVREMERTGIPASITLAQGIIESDYGRSRLAARANNHFGIKCHSSWKGPTITHDDDRRNECFRAYSSAEESFRDHSDFLVNGSRYRFLFDYSSDDYKSWARGLKKAGYATNPRYANMLINTIEENRLWQYDRMTSPVAGRGSVSKQRERGEVVNEERSGFPSAGQQAGTSVHMSGTAASRILERNRIQYIIVREGDTYESLAADFNLLSWEVFRYNDLPDDARLVPGQVVYIQPKRNRAEAGNDFHVLKEGETMYTVSQLYGIKLKVLYERNGITPGVVPAAGTELWLRRTKPEGL